MHLPYDKKTSIEIKKVKIWSYENVYFSCESQLVTNSWNHNMIKCLGSRTNLDKNS